MLLQEVLVPLYPLGCLAMKHAKGLNPAAAWVRGVTDILVWEHCQCSWSTVQDMPVEKVASYFIAVMKRKLVLVPKLVQVD